MNNDQTTNRGRSIHKLSPPRSSNNNSNSYSNNSNKTNQPQQQQRPTRTGRKLYSDPHPRIDHDRPYDGPWDDTQSLQSLRNNNTNNTNNNNGAGGSEEFDDNMSMVSDVSYGLGGGYRLNSGSSGSLLGSGGGYGYSNNQLSGSKSFPDSFTNNQYPQQQYQQQQYRQQG